MNEGRIIGVDHIGVAVPDAAAAGAVFRGAFDLAPGTTESLPDDGVRSEFYPLGPHADIEFIEPAEAGGTVERFLARKGQGLHHIALRVEGLDGLLGAMRARGVHLIDEVPRRGAHGRRVAFVHPKSMNGILLELVEHPGREQC